MSKPKKGEAGASLIATVDAAAFAKRLGFVQGALPRRNTIPILDCVLLEADDGLVRLSVTNLDQQSEVTVESDTRLPGAVCVDARRLLTVCARMTGELLITQEGNTLKLSAGRARAELPTLPAGDFASMRAPENADPIEISSGALSAGIGSVLHAVSKEETRYYLCGVYMQADNGALVCTATDGHRLATIRVTAGLPAGLAFEPAIVPTVMLRDILKFCERIGGPVVMTISDDRLQVAGNGECHITKLIDGNFPDYERVIPKGPGTRISLPRAELKAAVAMAITGTDEKSSAVKFECTEGVMTCRSRQDVQWAEGSVEATDIPPCVPFGLNGNFVLQALDAISADLVELIVTDSVGPVRVETGDSLRQVVMPLRV